jgi:hypothetical protein
VSKTPIFQVTIEMSGVKKGWKCDRNISVHFADLEVNSETEKRAFS